MLRGETLEYAALVIDGAPGIVLHAVDFHKHLIAMQLPMLEFPPGNSALPEHGSENEAAANADLFFPIDTGAKRSATIGGMILSNAGGNRVLRYGMMHNYVLGAAVVLPDGAIISRLSGLLIFVMASLTRHPRAAIIGGKLPFAVALAVVLLVLTLFLLITLLLPRHFGY